MGTVIKTKVTQNNHPKAKVNPDSKQTTHSVLGAVHAGGVFFVMISTTELEPFNAESSIFQSVSQGSREATTDGKRALSSFKASRHQRISRGWI